MKIEINKKSICGLIVLFGCLLASIVFFHFHGMTIKQTLLYVIIALIAIVIHLSRLLVKNGYFLSLIGINKSDTRDNRYDYIRVLAVLLVIITHTLQIAISKGCITDGTLLKVYTCIYILALACNSLYIMVSGALLLKWKDEKLSTFYLKRLPKIIFPMVIYYYFFLWQNMLLHEVSPLQVVVRLYSGQMPETPHFWLLLVIISLYVVYPFLRYMLKELPYGMLTAMVIIAIIFMFFTTITSVVIYQTVFLADWIGVALIGYWLSLPQTKKYNIAIIIFGIISGVIICYLILNKDNYLPLVTNCSPFMTLFSMGLFACIFNCELFIKKNYLIQIISKLSYSLILIHWWTVNWLTFTYIDIDAKLLAGIPQLRLSVLFTLVISILISFVIDNFVVIVVNFVWDKIVDKILTLEQRKLTND
mgnify:CR=1 FL=1